MDTLNDTIAAIATPLGEAGISVIRVSGPLAIDVCDDGFRGKGKLREAATHTAHFGDFVNRDGEKIDEVIATIFRAPHSFTTDDVVEISCHGGIFVTKTILAELIQGGARPAEPGEFTKRAFLNGRIDLSQAEAVADIIHSRSRRSHQASVQQLSGRISQRIMKLRQSILDVSSLVELELDFSEEGIDLLRHEELIDRLETIMNNIREMLSSYERGRLLREGVKVVLTGRPNVGKSSILNNLLQYDRAIVSEVPGTTRDTLEETMSIDGLLFSVTDTAGLRNSIDKVEELGIERARQEIKNADVILFVVDTTTGPTEEEISLINYCKLATSKDNARLLVLENKIDLSASGSDSEGWDKVADISRHKVSAKTGSGIEALRLELLKIASTGDQNSVEGSVVITSERHQNCLKRAMEFSERAIRLAKAKSNSELIAENLNMSTKTLGEIIGIVTSEDVLNNIFSHFCIGK